MDGNRRWAKKQGLKLFYGHGEGVKTIERVIDFCIARQIPHLSLYTLSIENLKRSPEELQYLLDLLVNEGKKHLIQAVEKGARIKFIGDATKFPEQSRAAIAEIEEKTKTGTKLQVNLLFCYGGQQEIVQATRALAARVQAGELKLEDLNEQMFQNYLWTAGIPAPDLCIKTGGRQRVSNFLLYQSAYSELYFLDCLWPDVQAEHLAQAVTHYENCQRNFGA